MNHSRHHRVSRHSAGFGAAAADCVVPEVVAAPSVFACERPAVAERPREGDGPSSIPGRRGARLVPASAGISIGSVSDRVRDMTRGRERKTRYLKNLLDMLLGQIRRQAHVPRRHIGG